MLQKRMFGNVPGECYFFSTLLTVHKSKAGNRGAGRGGQNTWGPDWFGALKSWKTFGHGCDRATVKRVGVVGGP